MFKVNNKNTKTTSYTSFLVSSLVNLMCFSDSIADFGQVNISWVHQELVFLDMTIINPLHVTGFFLHPLKTRENQGLFDEFREYSGE